MKTEIIITLSKDDLKTLAQANKILKAIETARGAGHQCYFLTDDIKAISDIDSYIDGKFARHTMRNLSANELQNTLRLDENL